jgi:hypothetical protein
MIKMKVVKKQQLEKQSQFGDLAEGPKRMPENWRRQNESGPSDLILPCPALSGLVRPCPTNGEVFFGRVIKMGKRPCFAFVSLVMVRSQSGEHTRLACGDRRPYPFSVAQTSKSAVPRVSKPAGRNAAEPTWKSAIRQVWKPALRNIRMPALNTYRRPRRPRLVFGQRPKTAGGAPALPNLTACFRLR